jgi:hypothetical protein
VFCFIITSVQTKTHVQFFLFLQRYRFPWSADCSVCWSETHWSHYLALGVGAVAAVDQCSDWSYYCCDYAYYCICFWYLEVIRIILNQLPVKYGFYSVEGNKIRRTFSNGFSYIATTCKSPAEAQRIINDLNQLSRK